MQTVPYPNVEYLVREPAGAEVAMVGGATSPCYRSNGNLMNRRFFSLEAARNFNFSVDFNGHEAAGRWVGKSTRGIYG
ncbi:hypothetical protein [Pararhizobium sp.]|uniref:hypothetical protein n=1 Tax=Pararhizobium sp. TaxID=1977563 RepID=UPI003D0CD036